MTDRTHPDSGRIITSGDVIAELQDRIAELESQLAAPQQSVQVPAHPACKPDILVNGGALKLALNVLRRAGKTEVADELEKTAQPAPSGDAEDAARLDWIAIHGSFGVDSVSGLVGGNGQRCVAATRKNIDAARKEGKL